MTIRRIPIVVVATLVTCGLTPAIGVYAGPAKGSRLDHVGVAANGTVSVSVSLAGSSDRFVLAQVSAPRVIAIGAQCLVQPTDYAISQLANRLGLSSSLQLVPDQRGPANAVYLAAADIAKFDVQRTLNLQIVRGGLARVSRARGTWRRALIRAQRAARHAHRGMWRNCTHK